MRGSPAIVEFSEGRQVRLAAVSVPVPQEKPVQVKQPPIPQMKPEVISPTAKGNELLDFIGKLESSDNYKTIFDRKRRNVIILLGIK